MVYRLSPTERWRRATTTSISDTQISFMLRSQLKRGSRVQVRFVVRSSSARSEVECWTRITRVQQPQSDGNRLTYTAAIESYKFCKVA